MKSVWENSWFTIPVLLFFNMGLLLVYCTSYGDEILFFNGLRHEPLNSVFRFVTHLGEAYAYIICGVAALFWRYRFTVLIALTGLITLPTVYIVKESIGIDRPISFFKNQDMRELVVTVPDVEPFTGKTSFPSGHTVAAFCLYSMLTLIVGEKRQRWGLAFALLAILVALSRVFLVQHFLADTLAGALLGLLVSGLVWRLDATPFFRQMHALDGRLQFQKKKVEEAGLTRMPESPPNPPPETPSTPRAS